MKKTLLLLVVVLCHSFLYAQNIGLNTAAPTRAKLEQNTAVGNTTAIFGSDGNGIGLVASWPQVGFNTYYNNGTRAINNGYGLMQYLDPGSGAWAWDVFSNTVKDQIPVSLKRAFTFAANARLSIGTNAGFGATLNVSRPAGFDGTAYFGGPYTNTFNYGPNEHTILYSVPTHINLNTTNSKLVIGNGTGLLGIGWYSPVYPLEIHGNDKQLALTRTNSQNRWVLTTAIHTNPHLRIGTLPAANVTETQRGYYQYTNGWYFAVSDSRLKENVVPLEKMLEKIMALKPASYEMRYNNPGQQQAMGFIAQELGIVLPELVHARAGTNSGYKDIDSIHLVNYSGLAPVVVKGQQEQQQLLENIKNRVSKLESLVENFK